MSISPTNAYQSNTSFNQYYSNSLAEGNSRKKLEDAKSALLGDTVSYQSLVAAMGELADHRLTEAQDTIQQLNLSQGSTSGGSEGGNTPSQTMQATAQVQMDMGDIQAFQNAANQATQTDQKQKSGQ